MSRPLTLLGVLCILLGCVMAHAAGAASFEPTACDLPGVDARTAPRLQCGTVAVPRDQGSPDAGTFRLAVVIIKAATAAKRPDPVVYVAGGPGSALTVRAASIAEHEAGVVAPDRDLILVDQRGSGRSEPALCPDLAFQQLTIFAAGADGRTLVRDWRNSYGLCRLQMADDGVKPDWFGSQVTAGDFETVRLALGIERWNIYALSYGTAVAMTMMALHPESLRAVVLDSVFPPDPLPMTLAQTFGDALRKLFVACGTDAACAKAHPDLPAAFSDAERGLDAEPLLVPMDPDLGIPSFRLRGEAFRLIVDRLLYSRAGMAAVPAFIDAARRRDAAALQPMVGRVARGYLALAAGVMAAVECRERPSWREPMQADDMPVSAFVPGMCANWSAPGPPPLLAKDTGVPSLLLAGELDPVTPPPFAQGAAAALGSEATVVVFPNVGHGAQQSSPCGEALVAAFMRRPSRSVNTACAASPAPLEFR